MDAMLDGGKLDIITKLAALGRNHFGEKRPLAKAVMHS
jgi:hypothetical protein